MTPKFIKLETISLKTSPEVNERWVQQVIENDPKVLGLGDVVVIDRERIQPGGGRLDLLLQDEDRAGRYVVALQLGPTDETHSGMLPPPEATVLTLNKSPGLLPSWPPPF